MTIEIDNAKEEIREIAQKCIRCGMCKELCPVFKIIREEHVSPRGQIINLDNDTFEKIVYECTLCKACETKCPMNLEICKTIKNARKILVLQGKEPSETKLIKENIQKTGNVYGLKED